MEEHFAEILTSLVEDSVRGTLGTDVRMEFYVDICIDAFIGAIKHWILDKDCMEPKKLDSFAKARGWKQAKRVMLEAMENDLRERFQNQKVHLEAAYTCSEEEALQWKQQIEEKFPQYAIHMDRLSLSVACHIGPGAIAIACSKEL